MKKILVLDTSGVFLGGIVKWNATRSKLKAFIENNSEGVEIGFQNFSTLRDDRAIGFSVDAFEENEYDLYLMSYDVAKMWGEEITKAAEASGCKLLPLSPTALTNTEKGQREVLDLIAKNA